MKRRDAVLTIPATIAAIVTPLRKPKASPTEVTLRRPRDIVRQAELQEVVTLQNRVEVLCTNLRRRLEAGATLEPGLWGASTAGLGTLKELVKAGIGNAVEADGYGILDIAPAGRIKCERKRWPGSAHEMWA